MKLHRQQIEMLAASLVKKLAETGNASFDAPEEAILLIERTISDDLQIEDKLNEEVRAILAQHESEMRIRGVEYHDMFKAVKQKLVRERKLIL